MTPTALFMESLHLYTSYLLSMGLYDDNADSKKPDRICYPTLVVNESSGLFLHLSVFSIKHPRPA